MRGLNPQSEEGKGLSEKGERERKRKRHTPSFLMEKEVLKKRSLLKGLFITILGLSTRKKREKEQDIFVSDGKGKRVKRRTEEERIEKKKERKLTREDKRVKN